MSNIMGLDLKVDEKYIGEIVKNVVQASIAEALGAKDDLVNTAIKTMLTTKVDRNGKVSNYSSDNKYNLIDYYVHSTVTDVCKEMALEIIQENRDALKAELKKQLSSERSVEAFTKSMIDSTMENLNREWSPSITVQFDKNSRY
ncbi:Uncharacterised protein [Niallia circulans]|uniref:hypothetical protein n=1 Tax=Niallia TaxID=2837506 RepID=UPI00077CAB55|nr:hypothetical protein [Niallia circulans]MDR4318422.1 hypothetical protein [Niallia circulans]MED3839255.1 hypothetical protein [Niallia circulans]MED4242400.1 hypothetical protein [Niallia circulans]MED4250502.1 hypothetical protein [Niallia circulans]QKH59810.1 hypothetical protein FOC77_03610 [Niallia circulans]